MQQQFTAECLVSGQSSGELLFSQTSLSFWGGVDLATGQIVDHHHPLCSQSLKGRILAIPSGRGSCTGSGALLELLLNGNGPIGLIFQHHELILTLGDLVAQGLFSISIPAVVLASGEFDALAGFKHATIIGNVVMAARHPISLDLSQVTPPIQRSVTLSERDEEMLRGSHGPAAHVAMDILVKFAGMQGAECLIDIAQAHIDACIYIGPASLSFAQKLVSLEAKFVVPTTMNSISLDYRRWSELGVMEEIAKPARDLADAYMSMGAKMSFTCAPYLLDSAPKAGQQIGWAESNAVVYANSVLGARTQKYPDFLDVCIALTGRAPLSGCHIEANRRPTLNIILPELKLHNLDDSAYPVIGYLIGQLSGPRIPLIHGLEHTNPKTSDLKAFSAAFATTASSPMFHINNITPETKITSSSNPPTTLNPDIETLTISSHDLISTHSLLTTAPDPSVHLISLGNPHFTLDEFASLSTLLSSRHKHPSISLTITTSRHIHALAQSAGYLSLISAFGAEILTDTCWCMLDEPVVPRHARNIMTNSAKFAHYAPGLLRGRRVHFGSLRECVEAACEGVVRVGEVTWVGYGEGERDAG